MTSYITNSCPLPGEGFDVTQTIIQNGSTFYHTRTRQLTRAVIVTRTTVQDGTTVHLTSLVERTARSLQDATLTLRNSSVVERTITAPPETRTQTIVRDGSTFCETLVVERTVQASGERDVETVVSTTTLDGSTIYRTTLVERSAFSWPTPPGAGEDVDGLNSICASLIERTITVEHVVERTVTSSDNEPTYITLTATENGSTLYRTSLLDRTVTPASPEPLTVTFTQIQDGSTFFRTSIIEQTITASPAQPGYITITFTEVENDSTNFRTSVVENTASQMQPEPSTVTVTLIEDHTTTIERSGIPDRFTLTLTEAQGNSTVYRTSVVERTVRQTDFETVFLTSIVQ